MPCEAWKYNTNLVPARVVPAYDTGGAARELDSAKPGRMDAQQGLLHVCSQIGASVAAPVEAANDEPAQAPPRRNSGWRRYGTSV
jgi:hypothetical protein